MNASQPPADRRASLPFLLASLTVAQGFYIAVSYLAPAPKAPPPPPSLPSILSIAAAVFALAGLAVESWLVRAATHPGGVRQGALISAAFGEAPSILGLVVYLLAGQRNWFLFGLGLAYYSGLWLRLPNLLRRMDELSPRT